jgi:hypothetical protein
MVGGASGVTFPEGYAARWAGSRSGLLDQYHMGVFQMS